MANNEFLVSVADAVLRDPNTGDALAFGKANITSAFTLTTAQTDVRGGINNPLLYTYIHDRVLEVKIEQAIFGKTILAINAGQLVKNGAVNVTQTECVQLTGGDGLVTLTPIGDVTVFLPDGTIQTVTPSTKTITVSGGGSQKVDAVYITSTTSDQITIESTTPPSVVDLTLIAQVRDNTGVIVDYLQISVPRFQVMGNYTLSLAANGVSNETLDGKALVVASADCTTADYYAKVTWIPVAATAIPISSIAAIPTKLSFSAALGAATKNISVLGIRGGIYANANITTSCSIVKTSGCACFSVGLHTGAVAASGALAADSVALITVTYYDPTSGSLTDIVNVSGTA